jgi:hypothetical protein
VATDDSGCELWKPMIKNTFIDMQVHNPRLGRRTRSVPARLDDNDADDSWLARPTSHKTSGVDWFCRKEPGTLRVGTLAKVPVGATAMAHVEAPTDELWRSLQTEKNFAPALPSAGAVWHASGHCRPCAHVWRWGGCNNGRSCTFCHACDEDSFRNFRRRCRAKKKMGHCTECLSESPTSSRDDDYDTNRSASPDLALEGAPEDNCLATVAALNHLDKSEGAVPDRRRAESVPLAPHLPSVGSAAHARGQCAPCAHSWRPNGCSKGKECTFCHICGEKEFRDLVEKKKLNKRHKVACWRNFADN